MSGTCFFQRTLLMTEGKLGFVFMFQGKVSFVYDGLR